EIAGAQFEREVAQFMAQAVAYFFAAEHNAPKILAVHPFFRSLVEQMINKGRNANNNIRFEFSDLAEVPVSAHDFAAARTECQDTAFGSGVVGDPERQVRSERKRIKHTILGSPSADFDQPFPGDGEPGQVVLTI